MDKKKLIGTIIGVTLFALLIAGATFAWLTYSFEATNGSYVGQTKNFSITYLGGTDIVDSTNDEGIPTLSSPTAELARKLYVSAARNPNSPDGTFYLKMTTTSNNELTTGGALKYAVCTGTKTGSGESAVITPNCNGELTENNEDVLSIGSVDKYGEIELYNTGTSGISTDTTYYVISFWLDPAAITNDMVGSGTKAFSGYIHASAIQCIPSEENNYCQIEDEE